MYKEVPLDALKAHPKSSNKISRSYGKKLRHNISETGQYEALTVRPHPTEPGQFEVLNGHARLAALRDLGAASAKCDIWEVDNAQTELFLAVLNKLHGSEVPELRMDLLLALLKQHGHEELSAHVPESKAYLARLLSLPPKNQEALKSKPGERGIVIVSFYLSQAERDMLNRALEHIMQTAHLSDSSKALIKMTERYLDSVEGHDALSVVV